MEYTYEECEKLVRFACEGQYMDSLIKAAEMAEINETGRVRLNNHVNDETRRLIKTDSIVIGVDAGQERPMLKHEKHKGGMIHECCKSI